MFQIPNEQIEMVINNFNTQICYIYQPKLQRIVIWSH